MEPENSFDALLAELAPLAKAMAPADGDKKIEAAADEADAAMPAAESGEGEGAAAPANGGESDDTLGKSFPVTLPDGSVQDAFDATDLIKSLDVRLGAAETAAAEHSTTLEKAEANLAKALEAASLLVGMVKAQHTRAAAQDDLIKSLQADVTRIGQQPAGRRAVLSVVEKPSASGPTVPTENKDEIMAKAMTACAAGTLMARDVARLEATFNNGLPAPADILAALSA